MAPAGPRSPPRLTVCPHSLPKFHFSILPHQHQPQPVRREQKRNPPPPLPEQGTPSPCGAQHCAMAWEQKGWGCQGGNAGGGVTGRAVLVAHGVTCSCPAVAHKVGKARGHGWLSHCPGVGLGAAGHLGLIPAGHTVVTGSWPRRAALTRDVSAWVQLLGGMGRGKPRASTEGPPVPPVLGAEGGSGLLPGSTYPQHAGVGHPSGH